MISLDVFGHAVFQTAKISVPAVLAAQRGPLSVAYCDEKLRRWAERLLSYAEVRLKVVGQEHLDGLGQSCVVMSNHQSVYDIPVWFAALPLSIRMAAKAELFRTPVWGKAMMAAGFVKIDRGRPDAARAALAAAGLRMQAEGLSLCIAPEGTRSPDGAVRSFKRGGFEFARATGFPIVPVAVDGTRLVLGKKETRVRRGQQVVVRILPAIVRPNFDAIDELRESVRAAIAEALLG